MKSVILVFLAGTLAVRGEIPWVPNSVSPNRKFHAAMDVDRDPSIVPQWKERSYPRIEITERATGTVWKSVDYFGAAGDDAGPLREHVYVSWRGDSKAFAITIRDRFYSSSRVFVMDRDGRFMPVPFPSYETMTGFPAPDVDQLRSGGRETVEGWDANGRLTLNLFRSPLPSYRGKDPLRHKVVLEVSADKMTPVRAGGISVDDLNSKSIVGQLGVPLHTIRQVECKVVDMSFTGAKFDSGRLAVLVLSVDGKKREGRHCIDLPRFPKGHDPKSGAVLRFWAYETVESAGYPTDAFHRIGLESFATRQLHFRSKLVVLKMLE